MNLEKLKQILIDSKIFVRDRNKNFIAICYMCGDHKDPRKRGHLYISKNAQIPIAHCWFCGQAIPITKLITDLTGNKNISKEIISEEELQNSQKQQKQYSSKKRFIEYKLPEIDYDSFSYKRLYIRKRTNNQIEIEKIPHLVFDFLKFLRINNLDIVGKDKTLSDQEIDILQSNFVGFLGEHNTTLFCRNIDPNSAFKFKKIPLQNDGNLLLEYWAIKQENLINNTVVLTEGIFNSIGEYITDSLKIKDKVRIYASGNTFSYSSLLKSVCYDTNIYKANVIILSDNDKKRYHYNKFLNDNSHVIQSCKLYINKTGKDFGIYPQVPIELL